MSPKPSALTHLEPSLEGLANANGVSIFMILAALHNPEIWEVIGGGYGGLTPAAKKDLNATLTNAISVLHARLETGDLNAAPLLLRFAVQRAFAQ